MLKFCILHITLIIISIPLQAQETELITLNQVDSIREYVEKPNEIIDSLLVLSQDSISNLTSELGQKLSQVSLPEKYSQLLDSLSKKYNYSDKFYAKWDSLQSNIDDSLLQSSFKEVDHLLQEYQPRFNKIEKLNQLQDKINPNVNPSEVNIGDKIVFKKFNKVQSEVKQNIPDSSTLSQYKTDKIDQLVEEQALKNEQLQELKKQAGQAGNPTEAITSKGDELNQQMEQAQDPAYLRRQAALKAYMVANDVAGEQMEQLQSAMGNMQKYKKKYFSVDNSADVDAGIEKPKRAEPLNKHWSWGGNFQFDRSNPLGMDLAPTLQYSFNRTFSLGTSLTWRYKFDKDNDYKPPKGEDMTYGLRLFGQYKVIRSFFVQAEYEKISMPAEGRSWQQAFNAGVGKTFTISDKLKGNITILYNLNHNRSEVYEKPWLVRFGVTR